MSGGGKNCNCEWELAACNEQRKRLVDTVLALENEIEGLKFQLAALSKKKEQTHGLTGYGRGCRCELCYVAASKYQQEYREIQKVRKEKAALKGIK